MSVLDLHLCPSVLLDDRLDPDRGALLYRHPETLVSCDDPRSLDQAFVTIAHGLERGLHAAGFLAYELGHLLEPSLALLLPEARDTPLLSLGLFPPPVRIDPKSLDTAFARLPPPPPIAITRIEPRASHVARVRHALERIAAGDVYQVNLTFPIDFTLAADPLRLYAVLRARQPAAHGACIVWPDRTILSVSPELWIETSGQTITARPMKGTTPRNPDPARDRALAAELAGDPKQRAENLMIVDLLRNDLARVARPGSVAVPALFDVETYPGFHALTSTITATLDPRTSLRDRIAALFPNGSVVGAPKIAAAAILHGLEPEPRGVYTGAIGAIAPTGELRFNVAIRTATLAPGSEPGTWQGRWGTGGGIVADSDPDAEFDEALLKARVLTDCAEPFDLVETFRWSAVTGFPRLDAHLARLARSATELGFAFDRDHARRRLCELAASLPPAPAPDRRVRMVLARDGTLALGSTPLEPPPDRPLRVGIARQRLDPADPFLRHKTTRRAVYDAALRDAEAAGLDDAILLNRNGEACEATRASLFIERNGRLITPPEESGLLPGILRAELLDNGAAMVATLSSECLARHPIRLGSSLRGLRAAILVV